MSVLLLINVLPGFAAMTKLPVQVSDTTIDAMKTGAGNQNFFK